MDFCEYQLKANKTDQVPGKGEKSIVVPLLGLAGEAGSLLTEYKKRFRDGSAYRVFSERIAEELGDILWYVANIATKAELTLEDIAQNNLTKTHDRWRAIEEKADSALVGSKLFDEGFSPNEQLPRQFTVSLTQVLEGDATKVLLTMDGTEIGNRLTDNTYDDDGYRFHDVFHLAYASVLGWSPVIRGFMKRKRRSIRRVDEIEDGGRAAVIEEAISAIVFNYARTYSFFDGVDSIEYELLRNIKSLTSHLEVSRCSTGEWVRAILEGFRVWREVRKFSGGTIVGDLLSRSIRFGSP